MSLGFQLTDLVAIRFQQICDYVYIHIYIYICVCMYIYIYAYNHLFFLVDFVVGKEYCKVFLNEHFFWSWAQILASLNNKVSVREGPRRAGFDSTVCGCPLRFYVWVILTEDRAPHSN